MKLRMSKKYFNNDYCRKKPKTRAKQHVKKPIKFWCKCCKEKFNTQARFSNSDNKYIDYCSNCRKVCFVCRCRHGGRGNTCSKFCADRYKKLCWQWKLHDASYTKKKLDSILCNFDLHLINTKILIPIYESKTTYIQRRCNSIDETLLKLQDHTKLESIGEKLILDEHLYINKNDFRLYKDSFPRGKIESYNNS
jgi:hypothetical protein